MAEVDLLNHYPKAKRNLRTRVTKKTPFVRSIARKFDKEYFDGQRDFGYGGYNYHPRFWSGVVADFEKYYNLTTGSSILDVGCGKGFMLYDFVRLLPGITICGVDISWYAIQNALSEMKPHISYADAANLPFADKSFDLVISINTIHNLPVEGCKTALQEIMRVSKKHAFITVDSYRNEKEKNRMDAWNLTALTYISVKEWKKFFTEIGYKGDYYWFIP